MLYTLYQSKMSFFVKKENTEVLHERQQQIIKQQQLTIQKTFHHQLDAVVAMTHDPDTTLWPNDHEH